MEENPIDQKITEAVLSGWLCWSGYIIKIYNLVLMMEAWYPALVKVKLFLLGEFSLRVSAQAIGYIELYLGEIP